MIDIWPSFQAAWGLVITFDPDALRLSGRIFGLAFLAVVIAALIALPVSASLALSSRRTYAVWVAVISAIAAVPTVLIWLGVVGLLAAVGMAEPLTESPVFVLTIVLVTVPGLTLLATQSLREKHEELRHLLHSLNLRPRQRRHVLLWEARHALVQPLFACLSRALSDITLLMIVLGALGVMPSTDSDPAQVIAVGLMLALIALTVMGLQRGLMQSKRELPT